jgi:5-methylthioadenosine/S-adenosylhomocysteine deaminase
MKQLYLPEYLYYQDRFQPNMGVLVDETTIAAVGMAQALRELHRDAAIVEWPETLMLPGTVNAHNHSFQSLLRGIATDRPFLEWRDQALYKFSPRLTPEDIYNGALLAFGEMLRYGVTTVSDFFYVHNDGLAGDEAVIQAARDLGIRLVLARTMYDWAGAPQGYLETVPQAVANTKKLAAQYADHDMVTIVPAPHSLHAASFEMIKAGANLAKELETSFHIHVAEEMFEVDAIRRQYGLRTIEALDQLGVVGPKMVIIHGVWLNDSEIATLGAKGGKLVYCPSSNMFLADGVTKIDRMLQAGVTVGLGSDGACSNNRISIFEEMRMVALLQKVSTLKTMTVNHRQAFAMGTSGGATVLNLPIGTIRPGAKADLVGVAATDLSLQPISRSGEQILPNIVYAMQPTAVKSVMVNGRICFHNGKLTGVSESKIIAAVQKTMRKFEA